MSTVDNHNESLKGASNVLEESTDPSEQVRHCITVSEAMRLHNQDVNVRGVIVSVSELIKMIKGRTVLCNNDVCNNKLEIETYEQPRFFDSRKERTNNCPACNCGLTIRYDYVNAVKVKLQGDELDGQLEQLSCILFEADTLNIRPGEIVEVKGQVEVEGRRDLLHPVLYSQSIKYERRQESDVTPENTESFKRFAKMPDVIGRLVSMFAPKVIGHNAEKLGILRSLVGSPENSIRGRIHTLLIGPPGVAKSMLTREAIKVGESNSRYVTAQNASGKGITAIIDKENDTATLRLGAVPQARGAICGINEIGRMYYEDQGFLLDIMEEGSFTVDKYAIHHEIKSATTIIATANPRGTNWNDPSKISNTEIPVLGTLLDRFDQVYTVSDFMSEEECSTYATKKAEMDLRNTQYNYNFLKPYIKHAKTINPTISPEAQSMLREFWLDLKRKGLATNRTLDSLFRFARSQARLHLSNLVNEEIVIEVMEDHRLRMLRYGQIIKIIESPREVTYREMLSIIKATRSPIGLTEAASMACQRNEQIRNYLGTRLNLRDNWKLSAVRDMLLDHQCIKPVNYKPIVLLWSEGISSSWEGTSSSQSDVSEACDDGNGKETRLSEVTGSQSDVSEACDDGNGKPSLQQLSEIEEHKKANHNTDSSYQGDLDDKSKDSTSHTSHTSLSLNVRETRASCDGHDSNKAISPVVSSKDTRVLPAAGEVSSIAESHRCFYCSEAFSNDLERVAHIDHAHPGKLYYATPEDFQHRLRPN